ncbi:hypothetical protein A4X03_0g8222 [Tilletia caries]|uniref:Uncharacterized protein n=2 Tax=Tilletia TaxID=13289 RepID=A0A8T8SJE3_9BASI|nr:hypothetical protein A4X03_0g8222 [Tilletia caries]
MRRGTLWVLRFGQGEKRALIVPHAQNGWTISASIFFILVLALGEWLELWGIFLAAMPEQLTGKVTSHKMPARVLNTVCLSFLPLAFTILMVPTAISDYHWQRVVTKDWPAFHHRYQDETELSREMLVDAQKIWNHLLRSSFMVSVACIMWFIICFGMTALYVWVSWRTISSLRRFLATKKPTSANSASADEVPSPTVRMVDISKESAGVRSAPPQTLMDSAEDNPTHKGTTLTRRTDSAGDLVRKMDHQATRKVLIYFTVQCICILGGGISLQILAVAVAATHYPEMEKQPRAPVLVVALACCCYITLLFGVVMVASVAYASLERPLLVLIQQASISAKTRLYPGGIGNATDKSIGTSEADGGLEAALRSRTNLESDPPCSDHRRSQAIATTLAERPSADHSPNLPKATFLSSLGAHLTLPDDGASSLDTIRYSSDRSSSYYDQEPGSES